MKSVTYVIESVRLMAVRGLSRSNGRLCSYLPISTLPKRRLLHHLLLSALIIAATTHGISSLILWLVHRVCERVDWLLDDLELLLLLSSAGVLWVGWIVSAHADHWWGSVIWSLLLLLLLLVEIIDITPASTGSWLFTMADHHYINQKKRVSNVFSIRSLNEWKSSTILKNFCIERPSSDEKLTIALLFAHVSWASYARLFQAGVFYAESSMTALGSSCLGTTLNIWKIKFYSENLA